MKVLVIPSHGPVEVIQLGGNDDASCLAEMQKIVGGYLEAITLPNQRGVMWLNEEGKFHQLPFNQLATILAAPPGDYIVGDVFITGLPDRYGETGPIPESTIEYVRHFVPIREGF